MTVASRAVEVPIERIERWIGGFAERHPGLLVGIGPGQVTLAGPGGANAVLRPAFGPLVVPLPKEPMRDADPPDSSGPSGGEPDLMLAGPPPGEAAPVGLPRPDLAPADAVAALRADALGVPVVRALLIRRGGYACAVVAGDEVRTSKTGTRHVQGRTAAGGWSQQRFARRREGQVDVLLDAVADVALRVLLPHIGDDDALVTGGDRALVERVLGDPRLRPLARLRRGQHLEVGDPDADLVQDLPRRCRSIRVTVDETERRPRSRR